jgi:hypothetical protein
MAALAARAHYVYTREKRHAVEVAPRTTSTS